MKQAIKNIWWQIKSATIGNFRWEKIKIDLDTNMKEYLIERSLLTGESVEQIIQEVLKKYSQTREHYNDSKRID